MGQLMMSNKTTWKGKYENETYAKITNDAWERDYSTLEVINGIVEEGEVFLFPSGFCKVITLNTNNGFISTTSREVL